MPPALQVVNYFAQGIAGTGNEPLTIGTGDPSSFYNVDDESRPYLAEWWGVDDAGPALLRAHATRFHDQQIGMLGAVPDGSALAPANKCSLLSPAGLDQRIYSADALTVAVDGSAGDNVNATIVTYYPNLPGIDSRLRSFEQIRPLVKYLHGVQVTLTPGAGDWGATVALNSSQDDLHAGRDYAVLGFNAEGPLSAVSLQGIDTGNLKVGFPVLGEPDHDSYGFVDFARAYNAALIPVINANNAGSINLQAADPAAGATVVVVQLAELSQLV